MVAGAGAGGWAGGGSAGAGLDCHTPTATNHSSALSPVSSAVRPHCTPASLRHNSAAASSLLSDILQSHNDSGCLYYLCLFQILRGVCCCTGGGGDGTGTRDQILGWWWRWWCQWPVDCFPGQHALISSERSSSPRPHSRRMAPANLVMAEDTEHSEQTRHEH